MPQNSSPVMRPEFECGFKFRRFSVVCMLGLFGLIPSSRAQDIFDLASTRSDDPCGLTKSPMPLDLEGAQLETQANDSEYMKAFVDWFRAQNALSRAENNILGPDGWLRSRQAKRDQHRLVRESKNLFGKLKELASVCLEVVQLRTELTSNERKRVHEISILRAQAKMLRDRALSKGLRAEADAYFAKANDLDANMKQVSEKLAAAIAERDRLKVLVGDR